MGRGLVGKTMREVWLSTLIFAGTLFLFETLIAYVLPTFRKQIFGTWLQVEVVQTLLRALVGSEMGEEFGPHVLIALPWVHPVVLFLVWTQEMAFCTRLPAGEIDKGTIDVLLGLPVSRWTLYFAESSIWLLSGVGLTVFAVAGNFLGTTLAPEGAYPAAGSLARVLLNFFCLYLAVGGIAYFVSSLNSTRGRAVGWIFAVVFASFFLNFLASLWEPARAIDFLSLLTYYRPMTILEDSAWPIVDTLVLALTGVVAWTAGGVIFRNRSICTV